MMTKVIYKVSDIYYTRLRFELVKDTYFSASSLILTLNFPKSTCKMKR